MFTVIFGFIGIPITVIMLTNFGRYLQNLEVYMSHKFFRKKNKLGEDQEQNKEVDELEQISMTLLFATVFLYLVKYSQNNNLKRNQFSNSYHNIELFQYHLT